MHLLEGLLSSPLSRVLASLHGFILYKVELLGLAATVYSRAWEIDLGRPVLL